MITGKKTKRRRVRRPKKSWSLLTDILFFLANRPPVRTLVDIEDEEDRENYNKRILQRIGVTTDKYTVLNIHQIGVNAPPSYVFSEILRWNGDPAAWPRFIATPAQIDSDLETIRILPLGWSKYPFGMKSLFGLKIIPLFLLTALRVSQVPDRLAVDNARYLLYRCSGGYPIGFFAIYVRSSIDEITERETSRLFITVGFDFYGRKNFTNRRMFTWLWKTIHNRVTSNVIWRLKRLCEWRFENFRKHPDLAGRF